MNLALENVVIKIAKDTLGLNQTSEWYNYSEDDLWFELVACNLGSRVRFELAKAAVQYLDALGLLRRCRLNDSIDLKIKIANALKHQLNLVIDEKKYNLRYPFPYLKAKHIVQMASAIYGKGHSIIAILHNCSSAQKARSTLVSMAPGIGAKQASLFLRNIGYSSEVAVLDAHVLRYMSYVGLLPNAFKSISSTIKYEAIESLFKVYSSKLNLKMGSLDIAIWVVMRTAQRELAI